MADDSVRIILQTKIDQSQKSISNLNNQINQLAAKLNKLDLKINIDEKFTSTLNNFINTFNKATQQTNNSLANQVKIVDQETKAINNATEAQKKWNAEKQKTVKDGTGQAKNVTTTYGNNVDNSKQVVSSLPDGSIRQITDMSNMKKDMDEQLKLIEQMANFRIKSENRVREHERDWNDKQQAQIQKNYQMDRDFLDKKDKDHALALLQNKRRDDDYYSQKMNLETKILDAQRRFAGDKNLVNSLDNLMIDSQQISAVGNFKKSISELDGQLKRYVTTANSAKSNSISFGEALSTAFQKFPIWMVAATAIYAPLRAIESGISIIYELDTAMTNLKKVTDESTETYRQFVSEANQVADGLGKVTVDVVNSAAEWARLGYSIQQSMTLAKESLLYSSVGDMPVEDASKSLISTIKGFGIVVDEEGQNVRKVVDLYNNIGNKYAISSEGIGEALRRSASSMRAAGNTIEESVALATAANSTIQDAARVGTALKSTSMRIRGIGEEGEDLSELVPKLEGTFNSLGLTLKKNDDTFKSTYEIMKDLATVWNSGNMSDFEKANIVELAAGKYHGNVISSLLDNAKDLDSALKDGLNSTGSAAKEHEAIMDSIQGKVRQFQNAVVGFWQNSVNSESMKSLIDIGTELIKTISLVSSTVGLLPVAFGLATAAIIFFNKSAMSTTTNLIPNMIGGMGRLSTFTKVVATDIRTMGVSATFATGALAGVRTAMTSLLISTGVGAAIAGVAWAVSLLVENYQKQKAEEKAFTDQQKTIAENWSNQKDKISSLISDYNTLNDVKSRTTTEEEKYLQVSNELAKLMPNLTKSIDDKGNAHLKNSDAIKKELEYAEKLSNRENAKKLTSAKDSFGDIESEREKLQKQLDHANNQLKYGNQNGRNFGSSGGKLSEDDIKAVEIRVLGLQRQLAGISDKFKDNMYSLISTMLEMSDIKFGDDVKAELDKMISSLDTSKMSAEEATSKMYEIGTAIKTIQNVQKSGTSNPAGLVAYSKAVDILKNSLNLTDAQVKSLIDKMNGVKPSAGNAANGTIDFANKMSELDKNIENTDKSLSSLANAYQTLNEGEQLSSATLLQLIGDYPQLASYLANTNDLTFNKGEILKQVAEIERQTRLEEAQNALDSVKNTRKELEDKQNLYSEFYSNMLESGSPMDAWMAGSVLTPDEQAKLDEANKKAEELAAKIKVLSQPLSFFSSSNSKPKKEAASPTPFDETENYKDNPFQRALKDLEGELKASESIMTRYKETSQEYRDELQKQYDIHIKQRDLQRDEAQRIRGENSTLQKRLDTEKLSVKQSNEVLEQLEDNKDTLADLGMKWWDYELSASESQKSILESTTKVNEELGKQREELDKSATKVSDDFIAEYKKGVKALIDAEDTRHKNRIDNIETESKKYEDSIDDALKALDRQSQSEDFSDEYTAKQKERAKLLNDIKKQDLIGDLASKEEKANLQVELDKVNADLTKLSKDRSKQTTKDTLNDLKDSKKKEVDANKAAEDKKYNDAKTALEAKLNDEELFLKARQELIDGDITTIQSMYEGLKTDLNTNSELIGESLKKNFINNLDLVLAKVKQVQSAVTNSGQLSDWQTKLQRAATNDEYAKSEITRAKDVYEAKKANGDMSGAEAAHNWANQIRAANPRVAADPLFSADTGGMTPSFSGGKFLLAHEKELILNKVDTSNLLKAVDITRSFMSNIKLPDFSNIINRSVNVDGGSKIIQIMGNLINVDKIDANTNVENVADRLINVMESRTGMKLRTT